MHTYATREFNIPELDGISQKSLEEHLGLYAGYVKNFNAMTGLIGEYMKDSEKHAHALSEILRRTSFEFGGMRLHEHYFAQWEGGAQPISPGSALGKKLIADFGSVDSAVKAIKSVGLMRGPGWSILYYDKEADTFHIGFSGEQHQGHFAALPVLLALDVWEHAFLLDYGAQGKAKYIDAFFKNLNWNIVEKRFEALQ